MDSPIEIVIVVVIAAVLLGPGRIPVLARSLGEAINEFRRAGSEDEQPPVPGVDAAPTRADAGRPEAEPADPAPGAADDATALPGT